jgi:hypothetical protein
MKHKVVSKKIEKSYEGGSGSLHIPFLGDLFPKLFSQEMKESFKYYVFTKKHRYEVEKHDYDRLQIGVDFDERLSIYN